ncbi:S49 family peptidase [Acetobacter okinawensis]|uniref:S49 family peptidase n=1 Tax=Acetobacter okinawensis TaxID=1076594 RepID=UPI0039E7CB0A
MKQYALIPRLLEAPVALSRNRQAIVQQLLATQADDMMIFGPASQDERWGAEAITSNVSGVAIIAIKGILLPGASDGWWWGGATFYDDITAAIDMAVADETVRAIVLHINSPGGTVAGCFDTADRIHAAQTHKPVVAIVDEMACSAAYALACSAQSIVLPRTGEVGSIGVVWLHADITAMLADTGIKVTTFQTGEHKTDGYPTTPLTEQATTLIQADIDSLGQLFFDTVARNRGLTPDAVKAMQAAVFRGESAVKAGLADAVMPRDAAFLDLLAHL